MPGRAVGGGLSLSLDSDDPVRLCTLIIGFLGGIAGGALTTETDDSVSELSSSENGLRRLEVESDISSGPDDLTGWNGRGGITGLTELGRLVSE